MEGWIKIDRAIVDSFVYGNPNALALWLDILIHANFKDGERWIKGHHLIVKRGQIAITATQLSCRSGVSLDRTQRILNMLEKKNQIAKQNRGKFSLITVINYDEYQEAAKQNPNRTQTKPKQNLKSIEEEKKVKKDKEVKHSSNKFTDDDLIFSKRMVATILKTVPGFKRPNVERWANEVRLMRERDSRTIEQIQSVFVWANRDHFWSANIQSPAKLRKQFDTLTAQMNSKRNGNDQQSKLATADDKLKQWAVDNCLPEQPADIFQPGAGQESGFVDLVENEGYIRA